MLKWISFLDACTPVVQVFDFLLMLFCGFYCLRSNRRGRNLGVKILAISCFVSAIILLGFFLSATYHNHALMLLSPQARQVFYLIARLLAPFELLLFATAIIIVAKRNHSQ